MIPTMAASPSWHQPVLCFSHAVRHCPEKHRLAEVWARQPASQPCASDSNLFLFPLLGMLCTEDCLVPWDGDIQAGVQPGHGLVREGGGGGGDQQWEEVSDDWTGPMSSRPASPLTHRLTLLRTYGRDENGMGGRIMRGPTHVRRGLRIKASQRVEAEEECVNGCHTHTHSHNVQFLADCLFSSPAGRADPRDARSGTAGVRPLVAAEDASSWASMPCCAQQLNPYMYTYIYIPS